MGTTADKLNKILETKQAIKQAIVDKGVDVADDTKFADYPSKITAIPMEGGDPYYEAIWPAITNNETNYQYLFNKFSGEEIDTSKLNTENVTDMTYMFSSCSKLATIDARHFKTGKVTDMSHMFSYCASLTEIKVGLSSDESSYSTNSLSVVSS